MIDEDEEEEGKKDTKKKRGANSFVYLKEKIKELIKQINYKKIARETNT